MSLSAESLSPQVLHLLGPPSSSSHSSSAPPSPTFSTSVCHHSAGGFCWPLSCALGSSLSSPPELVHLQYISSHKRHLSSQPLPQCALLPLHFSPPPPPPHSLAVFLGSDMLDRLGGRLISLGMQGVRCEPGPCGRCTVQMGKVTLLAPISRGTRTFP